MDKIYTLKINKTLLREMKENLSREREREILCSWVRRLNIFKVYILTKLIYKVNAVLGKISAGTSVEIDKLLRKLIWKCRALRIVKAALQRRNKVGELAVWDFKTYYKVRVIKPVQ